MTALLETQTESRDFLDETDIVQFLKVEKNVSIMWKQVL